LGSRYFLRISTARARELLAADGEGVQIIDVRDEEPFRQGHLPGAVCPENSSPQDFLAGADFDAPLLVYCYRGHIESRGGRLSAGAGLRAGLRLDGGYEAWREDAPGSD